MWDHDSKLFIMSWYISMKLFLTNLKLVMKKYLCNWYEYFPWVDYSSNYRMLSEMIKDIYFYGFNSIIFEFLYLFFTQNICKILINFISYIIQQMNPILKNWLNIEKVVLYVCYITPLVTICILRTTKRCQNFIIKFSYWIRNHILI